jgi:hypothetical protein
MLHCSKLDSSLYFSSRDHHSNQKTFKFQPFQREQNIINCININIYIYIYMCVCVYLFIYMYPLRSLSNIIYSNSIFRNCFASCFSRKSLASILFIIQKHCVHIHLLASLSQLSFLAFL